MLKNISYLLVAFISIILLINSTLKKPQKINYEYSVNVTNDSIYLYSDSGEYIGSSKLEGQFEKLIISDNE